MSAHYTTISTPSAPSAIGPYSQATVTPSLIFLSGCIPLDPVSMKVVEGGVEEQATQALKNVSAVLAGAGAGLEHVVKVTVCEYLLSPLLFGEQAAGRNERLMYSFLGLLQSCRAW